MSEQVEIAEAEKYYITLYYRIGENSTSRNYYNVSKSDKDEILSSWRYGTHVMFKSRKVQCHVDMQTVYEIRVEEVKSNA